MNRKEGPINLQNKVEFDMCFYFCRTGCENMNKMLKTDFEVRVNTKTDEEFIIKIFDELTKNHKEQENIVSGIMAPNPTDPLCSVQSFIKNT